MSKHKIITPVDRYYDVTKAFELQVTYGGVDAFLSDLSATND